MLEDRDSREMTFEFIKSCLAGRGPVELLMSEKLLFCNKLFSQE